MNLFGLIIGQHVLLVIFALIFAALGNAMLRMKWVSYAGILLFGASIAWAMSIILFDNARILGLPAALLAGLLAACYAAFQIYQARNTPRSSLLGGRSMNINRNAVISGSVLAVLVFITLAFLTSGNWDSFFRFDDGAAQQAYDQTTNGILRFANELLLRLDRFLAR